MRGSKPSTWAGLAGLLLLALWLDSGISEGRVAMLERGMESDSVAAGTAQADELWFVLSDSDGSGEAEAAAPLAPARIEPITTDALKHLLDRLPTLPEGATDVQEFAFPTDSPPAPRTGAKITEAFPPSTDEPAPEVRREPVRVMRVAPEGEVPLAWELRVTFSDPMIQVSSIGTLAGVTAPVELTPQPTGRWQWEGTRSLVFTPEGERFPMATEYRAEVPDGIASVNGAVLESGYIWSFTTPPPVVRRAEMTPPRSGVEPFFFLEFDQAVEPAAVLPTVRVMAERKEWPIRLATLEEVEGNADLQRLSNSASAGRWMAFKVEEDSGVARRLPAGLVEVEIGPGTPSAEGPLTTSQAQRHRFTMPDRLRVLKVECAYSGSCRPGFPWRIQFNNQLDLKLFREEMVTVSPPIEGMRVTPSGAQLLVHGWTKGRTKYSLRIDGGVRDIHGSALGEAEVHSISVGPAEPMLRGPEKSMFILDPAGPPELTVFTINHARLRLQLYAVGPEDWLAYLDFIRLVELEGKGSGVPGRRVLSKEIRTSGPNEEWVETRIDLSPALEEGLGHVVALIEPVGGKREPGKRPIMVWVQATRLGLGAYSDQTDLVAWVTRLTDASPVEGAQVQFFSKRVWAEGRTGGDGTTQLPLVTDAGRNSNRDARHFLIARDGVDSVILPSNQWLFGPSHWMEQPVSDSLRWHVFSDRGIYQPEETAYIKGWIRLYEGGKLGDVRLYEGMGRSVRWVLNDPRGGLLDQGRATVNAMGGFDFFIELPERMNHGWARLAMELDDPAAPEAGREFGFGLEIGEFRRPEYEVKTVTSDGPHIMGGHSEVGVQASYYAGGGLANAPVDWQVRAAPGSFVPPGWDGFRFGAQELWSWWGRDGSGGNETDEVAQHSGRTDADGGHRIRIDFKPTDPPRPYVLHTEATVEDVNRQAWTGKAQLLVHPANHYVGIRSPRLFVEKGEPLLLEAVLTDLDGKAVLGRAIEMTLEIENWVMEEGTWTRQYQPVWAQSLTSEENPVSVQASPKEGGSYRFSAVIEDEQGRKNRSAIRVWVSGGWSPPDRDLAGDALELIVDREEYAPGDTAEILLQSPFDKAEGLMILDRGGMLQHEFFEVTGRTHTLKVPILDGYIPGLELRVELTGSAPRSDASGEALDGLPERPAFASGQVSLKVPPRSRRLEVQATPAAPKLEPGTSTEIALTVLDGKGMPVEGAEVAVAVVDEAVLALTEYALADPIETFYSSRGAAVTAHDSRAYIVLNAAERLRNALDEVIADSMLGVEAFGAMPESTGFRVMAAMDAGMGGGAGMAGAAIRMRSDFDPLALFSPAVRTDASGTATATVRVPDNLTRYRVMAVAVAGEHHFGKGESTITARLPLMVRPSAPRFLNFGDRFALPVVVQNQTDATLAVDLAVRTRNLTLTDCAGGRVVVPANDRVEVRFPAAAERPGTARFQVGVATGGFADAAEVSLPVWTPATTEAFATYGELDDGALLQPLEAPDDVVPAFGGLEVSTSSTQLQSLTDAVIYLVDYPFECAEQLASRIMSIAALRPVLAAFEAQDLPSVEAIDDSIEQSLQRLLDHQNSDGGWAFWSSIADSHPYVSVHVAHALRRARMAGYGVPQDAMDSALTYLRNIEKYLRDEYSDRVCWSLTAYALNVRDLYGDFVGREVQGLIDDAGLDALPLEAIGWLLPILGRDLTAGRQVDAMLRHLNNRVSETAGIANFVSGYDDSGHLLLHSDRRTDAIVLEGLIDTAPGSDLIAKVVRGLLAHRVEGRWGNTQENAFVLLALQRYFAAFEETTPDFLARVWLGERYAGGHSFRGRTTEQHAIEVPMSYLAERSGLQDLILAKEGPGRLYYRVGLKYAPRSLKLDALDRGFEVGRSYEAVDDKDDVRRLPDGGWWVRAGARVRVKLELIAQSRRYHVALVDPLPAGLEPLNTALAITATLPPDADAESDRWSGDWFWWWRPWYEHENMRDERVEAFSSYLPAGVYHYSYIARATTPGEFVVPPARAEEMYAPETFGRSNSERMIVATAP